MSIIETPESDFCCPICLEEFKENDEVVKANKCCNKLIHNKCLSKWSEHSKDNNKFRCPHTSKTK